MKIFACSSAAIDTARLPYACGPQEKVEAEGMVYTEFLKKMKKEKRRLAA